MIDHITRKIVDMIPSRNIQQVSDWISKYDNIVFVSRDGSIPYRTSIGIANKNILQIADRFHLIKGLSEAISLEINRIMPTKIVVEKADIEIEQKKDLKYRYLKAKSLIEQGISLSKACIEAEITYITYKKIDSMIEDDFKTKFEIEKTKSKKSSKKQDIIDQVNKLVATGINFSVISRELNIDTRTVREYLDPKCIEEILNGSNYHHKNSLDKYVKTILELISKHISVIKIFEILKEQGYNKSYSNMKAYIRNIKHKNELSFDLVVTRNEVLNLLYHKRDNICFPRKYLNFVFLHYPDIKILIQLMLEFKDILINHKNVGRFENWLSKIPMDKF